MMTQNAHATHNFTTPAVKGIPANYLVQYVDNNGELHSVPFPQSWHARAQALTHLKAGRPVAIFSYNKRANKYENNAEQLDRAKEGLPVETGPRVNSTAYEMLSDLAVTVTHLQRQARKGTIDTSNYDTFRNMVYALDEELGWKEN